MKENKQNLPLNILLADDDKDDRFFFAKALEALSVPTKLTTVNDGEKLMVYLDKNSDKLPDVLFLDLNMPRKNGSECLAEIKTNKKLKDFPIIIYSTSHNDDIADILYRDGAYYYMRKCDLAELITQLEHVLSRLVEDKLKRPPRSKFVLRSEQLK
jgi:CheY-like chemotaxis protein